MAKSCISKMESLVVKAFKDVIRNVGPTEGKIARVVSPSSVIVTSTWSQRNVEREKTMQNRFVQLVDLTAPQVVNLPATENSTELLTSYSPSFKYRSVFRDVPPVGKKTAKKHLEIWENNSMKHLFDLSALDVHGDVYTDGEFGCFEWSSCETKLLYTAEKKRQKSEPFLPTPQKPSEDISYGTEYDWIEDWGETLVGRSSSVLVACDLSSQKISVLNLERADISYGQGVWASDGSIVCIGWETSPRRLGKVYCTNRSSRLYHITADTATCLTGDDELKSVMSPKFSHDGRWLVWLEREAGGPHNACVRLMKMDWVNKSISTVVDIVEHSRLTDNGEKFFGIFTSSLGNCWLTDNKTVVFSTAQRASIRSYAVDTESKKLYDISECSAEEESFSCSVLDIRNDLVLMTRSSLLNTPSLLVGRYNSGSPVVWTSLIKSKPTVRNYLVDIIRLESETETALAKDFSAIYFGPKKGENVPLIVFPHGGPHAASTNSYSMLATFFGRLGFAIVFVNYRGSIGAGEASVRSLLGNVSVVDLSDCHQSTLKVLESYSHVLSKDKCLLFGGSHGGFLVLHLSGQFPSFYKAVSARNPVVDIPSIFPISDIPDWALVESGLTYSPVTDIDVESFAIMKQMSPIIHAKNVKAPTLLLIGKTDLRVPPSQGINYHHALRARGIKTRVLAYEDNHQLPKTPHEVDFAINTVLWFLDNIAHTVSEYDPDF